MPADTSSRCVIAFQDRPGIHVTFLLSAEAAKKCVDLVELAFDNLVVIVTQRISRDLSLGVLRRLNLFTLKIIQRQYNDRSRAGQNFLRIATLLFAALHVIHFAVCALAQPCAKFSSVRRRSASRCATRIETNLLGIRYELRLQFRSRNLTRHDVAAIGGSTLQLRPILLSLLKIATATTSSVSTAVSTRIRATLA